MRRVNLVIVRIVLFLYLTSSYLSATHTDNQALEEHGDCKVCIIINNLHSANIPILEFNNIVYNHYYQLIYFNKIDILNLQVKGFYSNAPPSLS